MRFFSHRGTVNRCVQLFKVYGLCGRKNATETRRVACACTRTRRSTLSILEKLSPHEERERERKKPTHQGSNSWMMLSKRMTAKSLELKPASQARKRMVNDRRDCHPAGCDRPPDRPPAAPALLPRSTAALLRPFPEYDAPEFSDDLCLLSETG